MIQNLAYATDCLYELNGSDIRLIFTDQNTENDQ